MRALNACETMGHNKLWYIELPIIDFIDCQLNIWQKLTIMFVIVVLQSVTAQQQYRYVFDQLGITDKDKIRNLTHEQLVDAKYKIHQTDGIRDECSRDTGFQVGMVIGQIREKYKSMLEIYRQTRNKHYGKSKLYMPRRETYRPIHYFVRLEMLIALETDIDRLVHVLETIPSYRLRPHHKP